eukprot:GGOE01049443.1.p2 GENE.GGOE01049443.1~~GGOE01049443.1.p2  ORF type:complete len:189 (+),score=47.87 GGOE01049443.1:72-569(+)
MSPWDFCGSFVLGLLTVVCCRWARARFSPEEQSADELALLPEPEDAVMLLVVRKDLKMGLGKQCAQCCHGVVGVHRVIDSGTRRLWKHWLQHWVRLPDPPCLLLRADSEDELLAARTLAREAEIPNILIADAGRTQIARGSKTVLTVGPAPHALLTHIEARFKAL